jgi:hypothetical protein
LASKSLVAQMDLDMLVQIRFLGEAHAAFIVGAVVRLLICVDPQVIEEIVPFSKVFAAIGFLAFENLDLSL